MIRMPDPKDPDATKPYRVNWGPFLAGDTIVDSEWIVQAGIGVESESNTDTTTTIWVSGGTAGQTYELTNRITTAGGIIDDRTIAIHVAET